MITLKKGFRCDDIFQEGIRCDDIFLRGQLNFFEEADSASADCEEKLSTFWSPAMG